MKIRGWALQLDGVRDSTAADLPDGLTVVHGANESGKTLLLEHLVTLLFGAEALHDPTGESLQSIEPLARGQLVVDDGRERLVIERTLDGRTPPALRRADGSGIEPERLHHVLGGADERLFRAAFACGLDDLKSLAACDLDGLREALFSPGVAAAGRSARAALARLRSAAAVALDAEGSGRINQLIGQLNALRPKLNAARHAALAYGDRRAAADHALAAVEAQRGAIAARQSERQRVAALLGAWPTYQRLQAARAELASLESAEGVSDELEAELEAASARLQAAEAALTARQAEYTGAGTVGASPPPAGLVAVREAEIDSLCADLPLHRFHLATLPGLRARCAETQQRLNDQLQRSGADWSVERLRGWTAATHDRERARDAQARLRAAAEQMQQARYRLEAAQTLSAAARRERDAAAAEISTPSGPDAEEVARRRLLLADVRAAKKEMLARRSRADATAQALREHLLARGVPSAHRPFWPPAWLAPALAGGAVGAGAAALWWLGAGVPLFGLTAIVIAGAASAAARWTWQGYRASALRHEEQQSARRPLDTEIDAAQRMHEAERQRASEAADRLAGLAQRIGLSRTPSSAQLAEYERVLDEAAAADARAAAARVRLAELEDVRWQREAEVETRARELAAASAGHDALEREWMAWATAAGFGINTLP